MGWVDSVKRALDARGMFVKQRKMFVSELRGVVKA